MKDHRHYSIFDREKIVAFIVLILVVAVAAFAIGMSARGENGLVKCWVLCSPAEGNRVIVRRAPGRNSQEVGSLKVGDWFLTDAESKNGFIKCYGIGEYGEGWIYSGFVVTEEPEAVFEQYVCVAKTRVAVRRWIGGPQVDGRKWLNNGQNCTVFHEADGWACTSIGYIRSEWLEVDPE